MKRLSWSGHFAWSIIVILALWFGIWAGVKVTTANKNMEIVDLQVQLETANASLAEANVELAFWKSTLKGLAEGGQIEGVDFKAKEE